MKRNSLQDTSTKRVPKLPNLESMGYPFPEGKEKKKNPLKRKFHTAGLEKGGKRGSREKKKYHLLHKERNSSPGPSTTNKKKRGEVEHRIGSKKEEKKEKENKQKERKK